MKLYTMPRLLILIIVLTSGLLSHCRIKEEEDLVFPAVRIQPPVEKDTTYEFAGNLNGDSLLLNGIVKGKDVFFYNDSLEMNIRVAKMDTGKFTMINDPKSPYAKLLKDKLEYTTRHVNSEGLLHVTHIDTAINSMGGTMRLKLTQPVSEEILHLEGILTDLPMVHLNMEINGIKVQMPISAMSSSTSIVIQGASNRLTIAIDGEDLKKGIYTIDEANGNSIIYRENGKTYNAVFGQIVLTSHYPKKLTIGGFTFTGANTADASDQITVVNGSFAYAY